MIFRSIFWIGVVALLLPREPDLGFGRPASALAQPMLALAGEQHTAECRNLGAFCDEGLGIVQSLQGVAIRSLAQVKLDIEADERARSAGRILASAGAQ
jgi:hypothetical protein